MYRYLHVHNGDTSKSGAAKSGSHIMCGAKGPGPIGSGDALYCCMCCDPSVGRYMEIIWRRSPCGCCVVCPPPYSLFTPEGVGVCSPELGETGSDFILEPEGLCDEPACCIP